MAQFYSNGADHRHTTTMATMTVILSEPDRDDDGAPIGGVSPVS